MEEPLVRYDAADGIAVITIDRPAKRNALSVQVCDQLEAAWQRFAASDGDRVAILTATGDEIFTAGADLNAPPPEFWKAVPGIGVPVPKPVIAAVAGLVIGGGVSMTMMCDLCVAAENTRFVYPEARVGVALGMISAVAARMPHKIAMELMLLGEPIDARRAHEVGFVNRIVPVGEQLAAAQQMGRTLAASAPLVLSMLKEMVGETLPTSPVEAMYAARRRVARVLDSADAKEGLAAFREKRPPRYTGH
ncbi:MAG: enoyl-CoA hydratase/isomerase family protein [Burkholderiales bacterium]|nr:enoyl-CoA hydratase/isomerase family protein [Burkholderiales bacterium]